MSIELNADQIEQLTNIDLKKKWVDVHLEKNGEIKLDIWAKNWFKDGICRIISFISFGKLLNRKAAIGRVIYVVMMSHPHLFVDQSEQDIKGRNVQQLPPGKELKFALQKIKEQEQSSAAIMYSKGEDLAKVRDTYKTYLNDDDIGKAEKFIKGTDVEGNTFLHHYAKMKDNIQKDDVLELLDTLGEDNFKSLLLTSNRKGETPVSLALERGQIELISVLYPIAGQSILGKIGAQGSVIWKITDLISQKLSVPDDLDKLLKECPGANNFDKMNHIMDALLRMALYSLQNPISLGVKLADRRKGRQIPQELLRLNSFLDKDPIKAILGKGQWKEIYKNLRRECEAIKTPEGVHQKMVEWQYEPLKREPETIIPLPDALRENQDDPLTHLVVKALQTEDEAERNAYYNHVVALINPFADSDQQIDFSSEASLQVLHNLVDVVVKSPEVNLEDAKSLIKMLILKNPEFLTARNGSGDTIIEALEKMKDTFPLAQALLEHINDICVSLDQTLFENRVKRSLKYYLEDRGIDLSQKK